MPTTRQPPDPEPDAAALPAGLNRKQRPRWARIAILVSGWAMIFLGILGLFLPILQGILFLAIGAYLLSLESPWARRLIRKARRRYPKLGETMDAARLRAARIVERLSGKSG